MPLTSTRRPGDSLRTAEIDKVRAGDVPGRASESRRLSGPHHVGSCWPSVAPISGAGSRQLGPADPVCRRISGRFWRRASTTVRVGVADTSRPHLRRWPCRPRRRPATPAYPLMTRCRGCVPLLLAKPLRAASWLGGSQIDAATTCRSRRATSGPVGFHARALRHFVPGYNSVRYHGCSSTRTPAEDFAAGVGSDRRNVPYTRA